MSHLRVVIGRVDDEAHPDQMSELYSIDLPAVDPEQMQPETALDALETGVLTTGHEVMRHLLKSEWAEVDRLLVAQYQQRFSPSDGEM